MISFCGGDVWLTWDEHLSITLMAKNLRSGRVATVEGSSVAVRVRHGRVRVNRANVVKADVDAKNGVIYVIDRVLLPPHL